MLTAFRIASMTGDTRTLIALRNDTRRLKALRIASITRDTRMLNAFRFAGLTRARSTGKHFPG